MGMRTIVIGDGASLQIACAEELISRAVSIRSADQAAEVESFASVFQKYVIVLAHPASNQEGRFAIVTGVGCGMRSTR